MTKSSVAIGEKRIGPGEPIYLITEVGTTCLGDLDKALKLVEAGAAAGIDAVKFQVIDPDQDSNADATYTYSAGGQVRSANMREMFRRLQFTPEQWATIANACKAAGVHFFATVDYEAGVDMLEKIGVPAHKLGAWDTTFMPLVKRVAKTGKPVFVDLGPTTEDEIDEMVGTFVAAGGAEMLLLHDYHTNLPDQMNLRAVPYLEQRMRWPVGYSSPGRDDDIDMVAVGLGAHYLEKRLILSRSDVAFHADESCEPGELKSWVERVRRVEQTLGRPAILPSDNDLAGAKKYYRSICTLTPIKAGETFSPENLSGKRPGTGMHTRELPAIWGTVAKHDLPENHLLTPEDLA